jgi:hypothetical protein
MERHPIDVEIAGALEMARLDFEHVVAAVAVRIDPYVAVGWMTISIG